MARVIAHIGLHKTGTTYLQKEVLPQIRKLLDWDLVIGAPLESKKVTKNVLLSAEGLSGACMPQKNLINRKAGLEELSAFKRNGHEVRVVLFLRAHQDQIRSMFLQKRKQNLSHAKWSLDDYARILLGTPFSGYKDLLERLLDYPILLVDYDFFKKFPDATEQGIFSFSGIEIAKEFKMSTPPLRSTKKHNVSPSHILQMYVGDFIELTLLLINKLSTGRINIKTKIIRRKLIPILLKFKLGPTVSYTLKNEDEDILNFYKQDWQGVWELAERNESIQTLK